MTPSAAIPAGSAPRTTGTVYGQEYEPSIQCNRISSTLEALGSQSRPLLVLPFNFMPPLPTEADFIVVGAGIAGLRASVELAAAGRVLCLAKSEVTESNTQYAQGGIAAAL